MKYKQHIILLLFIPFFTMSSENPDQNNNSREKIDLRNYITENYCGSNSMCSTNKTLIKVKNNMIDYQLIATLEISSKTHIDSVIPIEDK